MESCDVKNRAHEKSRVAILILAHAYPSLLDQLVRRLISDFDVFLHLDKASKINLPDFRWHNEITTVKSRRTYWGSFEGTRAMLDLLATAHKAGYERYVFISGQDIPLATNEAIEEFFSNNSEIDFIQSSKLDMSPLQGGIDRIARMYWHAPYRYSGWEKFFYNIIEYGLEIGYRTVFQRKIITGKFFRGEQWFSLTAPTVRLVFEYLDDNPEFLDLFGGSRLAEELFLPTLVRRLGSRVELSRDTTSYVDWTTGPEKPRVLDISDLDKLKSTSHLFARKVHPEKSKDLIDHYYGSLEGEADG